MRVFFFFKQKTAYEMRISDWSSDVCSSDLAGRALGGHRGDRQLTDAALVVPGQVAGVLPHRGVDVGLPRGVVDRRSEEHTSELQSLMRISYAVFCLKKKN